jgi:hypothetical protein
MYECTNVRIYEFTNVRVDEWTNARRMLRITFVLSVLALSVAGCGKASEPAVVTLARSGEPGDADGPAGEAQFWAPEEVAVDADGNVIVAETGNHRVRKIVVNP